MKYANLPDYTVNLDAIVEIYWDAGNNYPAIYKDYKDSYSKQDLDEVIPEARFIEKAVIIHYNNGHTLTLMDSEEYGWEDYTLFKAAWQEYVGADVTSDWKFK